MNHVTKAVLKGAGWNFVSSYWWVNKYAKHPEKAPIEKRLGKLRKLTNKITKHLNGELFVFGKENILENEICCYFPNHYGVFDALSMIASTTKDLGFVGKKELEKWIFVGKAYKAIDGVFMDREDLKQSLKVMQGVQKSLAEKKRSWVIFPEGTRLKDQNSLIGDFHYGSFKSAMRARVPIVPVAIFGTFRILRKDPDHKYYPLMVSYLKPIYPEEYENMSTQEVATLVRKKIQSEIMYHLRPLDHELMSKNNKKTYRFNAIY